MQTMKIRLLAIASAVLLVVGFSLTATAGAILDSDVVGWVLTPDGIPDVFDNCKLTPNGPAGPPGESQRDTDLDGHGNVCDCDYTQDGFILPDDIVQLFANFNSTSVLHDSTQDGFVLADDIAHCFSRFNSVVGDP